MSDAQKTKTKRRRAKATNASPPIEAEKLELRDHPTYVRALDAPYGSQCPTTSKPKEEAEPVPDPPKVSVWPWIILLASAIPTGIVVGLATASFGLGLGSVGVIGMIAGDKLAKSAKVMREAAEERRQIRRKNDQRLTETVPVPEGMAIYALKRLDSLIVEIVHSDMDMRSLGAAKFYVDWLEADLPRRGLPENLMGEIRERLSFLKLLISRFDREWQPHFVADGKPLRDLFRAAKIDPSIIYRDFTKDFSASAGGARRDRVNQLADFIWGYMWGGEASDSSTPPNADEEKPL
jgi:hypothetical protein